MDMRSIPLFHGEFKYLIDIIQHQVEDGDLK